MPPVTIGASVQAALASYDWPGNVRALSTLVERTLLHGAFPNEFAGPRNDGQTAAAASLADLERRHILAVLKETGGNREEAARRLGVSRKTIDRKYASWNA